MESRLEEFYEMLKKDRELSEWSKKETLSSRADELKGEVDEIMGAIDKGDNENLKEELGDALWDLLCLIVIAEEKKMFTKDDIMKCVMEKYHRRKPWIREGKSVSTEEELMIWKEVKKKEKEIKNVPP